MSFPSGGFYMKGIKRANFISELNFGNIFITVQFIRFLTKFIASIFFPFQTSQGLYIIFLWRIIVSFYAKEVLFWKKKYISAQRRILIENGFSQFLFLQPSLVQCGQKGLRGNSRGTLACKIILPELLYQVHKSNRNIQNVLKSSDFLLMVDSLENFKT